MYFHYLHHHNIQFPQTHRYTHSHLSLNTGVRVEKLQWCLSDDFSQLRFDKQIHNNLVLAALYTHKQMCFQTLGLASSVQLNYTFCLTVNPTKISLKNKTKTVMYAAVNLKRLSSGFACFDSSDEEFKFLQFQVHYDRIIYQTEIWLSGH